MKILTPFDNKIKNEDKIIYFCEKMKNKLCNVVRYPSAYFFALSMEKKILDEKKEKKMGKK